MSSANVSQDFVDANDRKRGRLLQRAREDAGLEQEEVGEAVDRTRVTISRWENGYPIPDDKLEELIRFYRGKGATIPGELADEFTDVSRGTRTYFQEALDRPIGVAVKLETFKREMIRAGADDAEIDYIEETFRRPETARLAHLDSEGKTLSPTQVEEQYDALIDGVRHIISRRIERRRKAAKAK